MSGDQEREADVVPDQSDTLEPTTAGEKEDVKVETEAESQTRSDMMGDHDEKKDVYDGEDRSKGFATSQSSTEKQLDPTTAQTPPSEGPNGLTKVKSTSSSHAADVVRETKAISAGESVSSEANSKIDYLTTELSDLRKIHEAALNQHELTLNELSDLQKGHAFISAAKNAIEAELREERKKREAAEETVGMLRGQLEQARKALSTLKNQEKRTSGMMPYGTSSGPAGFTANSDNSGGDLGALGFNGSSPRLELSSMSSAGRQQGAATAGTGAGGSYRLSTHLGTPPPPELPTRDRKRRSAASVNTASSDPSGSEGNQESLSLTQDGGAAAQQSIPTLASPGFMSPTHPTITSMNRTVTGGLRELRLGHSSTSYDAQTYNAPPSPSAPYSSGGGFLDAPQSIDPPSALGSSSTSPNDTANRRTSFFGGFSKSSASTHPPTASKSPEPTTERSGVDITQTPPPPEHPDAESVAPQIDTSAFETEIAGLKHDLASVRDQLAKSQEARLASEACLKALRQFMSTAKSPPAGESTGAEEDGINLSVPPPAGFESIKLPPLPTDTEADDAEIEQRPKLEDQSKKGSSWGRLGFWKSSTSASSAVAPSNSAASKQDSVSIASNLSEAGTADAQSVISQAASSSKRTSAGASLPVDGQGPKPLNAPGTPLANFVSSWSKGIGGAPSPPTTGKEDDTQNTAARRGFSLFGRSTSSKTLNSDTADSTEAYGPVPTAVEDADIEREQDGNENSSRRQERRESTVEAMGEDYDEPQTPRQSDVERMGETSPSRA